MSFSVRKLIIEKQIEKTFSNRKWLGNKKVPTSDSAASFCYISQLSRVPKSWGIAGFQSEEQKAEQNEHQKPAFQLYKNILAWSEWKMVVPLYQEGTPVFEPGTC